MQNVAISTYLLCMGRHSLIIGDQADESIWKVLAMEKLLPDADFITYGTAQMQRPTRV